MFHIPLEEEESLHLDLRISLRSQMEASGVRRIVQKLGEFKGPNVSSLEKALQTFEERAIADSRLLQEGDHQQILRDIQDTDSLVDAVFSNVQATRAQDFFLSTLKHMLLIRGDNNQKVLYFQLIDRIVTALVMDRKYLDENLMNLFGTSFSDIASRFVDQDHLQRLVKENESYKELIKRLRKDKEALDEQLETNQGGTVNQLKAVLGRTNEELRISRQATQALEKQLRDEREESARKAADQELQIRELFKMLKESKMLEAVSENSELIDRHELLAIMNKNMERTRTIQALEGRHVKNKKSGQLAFQASPPDTDRRRSAKSSNDRKSRFEDASEEAARQHIEEALSRGASELVSAFIKQSRQLYS